MNHKIVICIWWCLMSYLHLMGHKSFGCIWWEYSEYLMAHRSWIWLTLLLVFKIGNICTRYKRENKWTWSVPLFPVPLPGATITTFLSILLETHSISNKQTLYSSLPHKKGAYSIKCSASCPFFLPLKNT